MRQRGYGRKTGGQGGSARSHYKGAGERIGGGNRGEREHAKSQSADTICPGGEGKEGASRRRLKRPGRACPPPPPSSLFVRGGAFPSRPRLSPFCGINGGGSAAASRLPPSEARAHGHLSSGARASPPVPPALPPLAVSLSRRAGRRTRSRRDPRQRQGRSRPNPPDGHVLCRGGGKGSLAVPRDTILVMKRAVMLGPPKRHPARPSNQMVVRRISHVPQPVGVTGSSRVGREEQSATLPPAHCYGERITISRRPCGEAICDLDVYTKFSVRITNAVESPDRYLPIRRMSAEIGLGSENRGGPTGWRRIVGRAACGGHLSHGDKL